MPRSRPAPTGEPLTLRIEPAPGTAFAILTAMRLMRELEADLAEFAEEWQ